MTTPSITETAAREYHAGRNKIARRDKPGNALSDNERDELIAGIFDAAYDVNRSTIAALVALGAHDMALAREQFGMMVADVRIIARLWDRLEVGGAL